jgi:DNA helicase-2/ATP-dependent DNA helicase PcrA
LKKYSRNKPDKPKENMQNKILQRLTTAQQKAVLHKQGPLLVIAGPGSGKTRVITYRIAALIDSGINPRNICAITFTNKAADQMRQRVFAMGTPHGSHISTFHSLCVRILRQYAENAVLQSNFSIFDAADQARCIKQAVKNSELDTSNFPPAKMLEAVSTLKNKLITSEDFEHQADGFFTRALLKIYKRYQQILQENNALDFDDLLVRTALLLESDNEVCSKLSKRFQYLLIDEYQDTNHAQYRIAKAIVCEHNNICATGDPDQSIYRWRGADIRNILDFERDWPNAVIVKLEENFRSTPNILQAADRLIAVNQGRKKKILVPTRKHGNDVVVNCYEDEQEEAEKVAGQIKQLKADGIPLNQIAVFYRVNAASRIFEEAFISEKIPYQIVRVVEFYSRKEIRDILAFLKILVNPDDNIALARIINTPTRGIGKTTVEKVKAYADVHNIGFYEALKKGEEVKNLANAAKKKISAFVGMIEEFKKSINKEVAPVIEHVFSESGLQQSLKDEGKDAKNALDNVEELINKAVEYDKDIQEPSLLDFLQQISLFSDVDTYDSAAGRVALMTLHNTKGLEFEAAFITGLEDGILPHERSSEDDDDIEEERRLFFVGITRAKSHLFISFAQYRTIRGQQLRTIPSQFLYELGIETAQQQQEKEYVYEDVDDEDTSSDYETFKKGQPVRHPSFGRGTIKEFHDMGQNSIVIVKFNSGQTKTLMLKYAKLEKI